MLAKEFASSVAAAIAAVGIILVSLSGAAPATAATHPGDLDPTFGADGSGQVTFDFAGNWDDGTHIMVQADGRYLAAGHGVDSTGIGFLARYLPDGRVDTSFNGTGQRVFGDVEAGMYLNDVRLQPDGKIVVVASSGLVMRLNGDGSTDESFANGGQLMIDPSTVGSVLWIGAIAVLPDGRLLIAGSEGPPDGWGGVLYSRPFTLRLLADGQPDVSYGIAGRVSHDSLAHDLVPRRIGLEASGKITVIGGDFYSVASAMAIRLNPDGTPDATFASGGKYVVTIAGFAQSELHDLVLELDGSLVMVGQSSRGNPPDYAAFAIRLTPLGQPDAIFGEAGVAVVPGLTFARGVTKQTDGKVLISGSRAAADANSEALVARLMSTGELDATFGTKGITTQSLGAEANAAVDVDGRIVLVGALWKATGNPLHPGDLDFVLTRLIGVETAAPIRPLVDAVEYYHPRLEHYFLTADAVEIGALDSGVFPGWWRTGQRLHVYADPGADRAPVCRFYTDAFAGKATHFYTASPAECEYVKRLPQWMFEGIAFYVLIPIGYGTGSGSCPAGTVALYRAYNNGQGGAPNHRYTTSLAALTAMIAQGWTFEGEAATKVFACVPL